MASKLRHIYHTASATVDRLVHLQKSPLISCCLNFHSAPVSDLYYTIVVIKSVSGIYEINIIINANFINCISFQPAWDQEYADFS